MAISLQPVNPTSNEANAARSDWSKSNEAPECGDLIGRERFVASLVSGSTGRLASFAVAGVPAPRYRPTVEEPASVSPNMAHEHRLNTFSIPECAASALVLRLPTRIVMTTNCACLL